MSADLLARQLHLQRSIDRALENFKKIGKANLTAAKIRTRIAALKDNWSHFEDGHLPLQKAVPAATRSLMEYFKDDFFGITEEAYQATWGYLMECLEELEPSVSHNQSFDQSVVRSDTSALSLSHFQQIRLPSFDGNFAEWENFRDRFTALIIKNKSLTDFARMHYLASSLKGRAR